MKIKILSYMRRIFLDRNPTTEKGTVPRKYVKDNFSSKNCYSSYINILMVTIARVNDLDDSSITIIKWISIIENPILNLVFTDKTSDDLVSTRLAFNDNAELEVDRIIMDEWPLAMSHDATKV